MVKAAKGTPTGIGRQPGGSGAPPEACPSLTFEIGLATGSTLRAGDPVAARVRGKDIQLMSRGRVVAGVDDEAIVRTIRSCIRAGGRYEGQVVAVAEDGAVILLEGRN